MLNEQICRQFVDADVLTPLLVIRNLNNFKIVLLNMLSSKFLAEKLLTKIQKQRLVASENLQSRISGRKVLLTMKVSKYFTDYYAHVCMIYQAILALAPVSLTVSSQTREELVFQSVHFPLCLLYLFETNKLYPICFQKGILRPSWKSCIPIYTIPLLQGSAVCLFETVRCKKRRIRYVTEYRKYCLMKPLRSALS